MTFNVMQNLSRVVKAKLIGLPLWASVKPKDINGDLPIAWVSQYCTQPDWQPICLLWSTILK